MSEYECDGCGVCCKAYHVFASDADVAREPLIAERAKKLPDSQATAAWKYQLYPLPFLDACDFLDEARCTIYATRPEVCRRMAAGEAQCQDARRRHNLPDLLPTRSGQGPPPA